MDLTIWLDYFLKALVSQMDEIQDHYVKATNVEAIAVQFNLSDRQKKALEFLSEEGRDLTIQQYQSFFPHVHRRTLQRDLSDLVTNGLIVQEGSKKGTRYTLARGSLL